MKIANPGASNYGDLAWAQLKQTNRTAYDRLYRNRDAYNWHHALDGTLQLVDKDLHTAYQHTGLKSILAKLAVGGAMLIPGSEALGEGRLRDAARDATWSALPLTWISDAIAGWFIWMYDKASEEYKCPQKVPF